MWCISAVVTRSFGARDTESGSTDDGLDRDELDRSRDRLLSGRRSPCRRRLTDAMAMGRPASEHSHTLIAALSNGSTISPRRVASDPDDVAAPRGPTSRALVPVEQSAVALPSDPQSAILTLGGFRKTFRLLMAGPTTTHFPGTTREHLDGPSDVGECAVPCPPSRAGLRIRCVICRSRGWDRRLRHLVLENTDSSSSDAWLRKVLRSPDPNDELHRPLDLEGRTDLIAPRFLLERVRHRVVCHP